MRHTYLPVSWAVARLITKELVYNTSISPLGKNRMQRMNLKRPLGLQSPMILPIPLAAKT